MNMPGIATARTSPGNPQLPEAHPARSPRSAFTGRRREGHSGGVPSTITLVAALAVLPCLVPPWPAAGFAARDEPAVRRDQAEGLARRLLDDSVPGAEREKIVADHPDLSSELISGMVADLKPGTPEEYRRIPWIWRVAIAAGRRNDERELRRLLDVSLPGPGAPLDDWRAVVIGGGLINGVSLAGVWPAERFEQLVSGRGGLEARWRRSLEQAAAMADDERVKSGTRYDALRMLGVEPWDRRGAQLFRYLLKGVHAELQQGAISGLSDVRSPSVSQALLSGMGHYSAHNRDLALDALIRDEARAAALLDAVADGPLKGSDLGAGRVERLLKHPDDSVRQRAGDLLGK
jgi:hypothetical protein